MKLSKMWILFSAILSFSVGGFAQEESKKIEKQHSIEHVRTLFARELDAKIVDLIEFENKLVGVEKEEVVKLADEAKEKNKEIQLWMKEALTVQDSFIKNLAIEAQKFLEEKISYLNAIIESVEKEGISKEEAEKQAHQLAEKIQKLNSARNDLYDHSDLLKK